MQDIVEIQITKYKKGTHPHDDGEVLCSYIISGSEEDKKLKALRRLLEYVKSKDDNLLTFKRSQTYQLLKFKTDGVFNEKGEIVFSKEIKRNKNKAKNIREEYKTTLFPNAYKDNKRFKSLVKYLYAQKSRLHEFIGIGLKNVETIVGGYNPSSVFKI